MTRLTTRLRQHIPRRPPSCYGMELDPGAARADRVLLLDPKPGDVLAVVMGEPWSVETTEHAVDFLQRALPGVTVVVATPGTDFVEVSGLDLARGAQPAHDVYRVPRAVTEGEWCQVCLAFGSHSTANHTDSRIAGHSRDADHRDPRP